MGITALIALALLLAAGVYTIQIYNNLARLKHGVARAWSNIDVVLKQRHDEIPKLVEVCKQYMGYERETLERVVRARAILARLTATGDERQPFVISVCSEDELATSLRWQTLGFTGAFVVVAVAAVLSALAWFGGR